MKKTERKLKKLTLSRETLLQQTKIEVKAAHGGRPPWTCDSKVSCCA